MTASIKTLTINTLRMLSVDMIEKANSGHPGLPMGAAPMAYALWQNHLKFDGSAPQWPDRDRFILSPGHGSALLYSLLHVYGYELPMEQIKNFRQWGSLTPGHPEFGLTPGVEATTGPLGQGMANAVGMAIAERALAHKFNKEGFNLVDHMTYALVSDGDIMEGITAEACSLAGHMKLGKLVCLYDSNDITLDGPTSLCFDSEDVGKRYESYGWQVLTVLDGDNDIDGLSQAIQDAKDDRSKPTLIIIKTTIGYGSPNKQGTSSVHGSPLGADERALTRKSLDWQEGDFHVPASVPKHCAIPGKKGAEKRLAWEALMAAYKKAHPEAAEEWDRYHKGELEADWQNKLPTFEAGPGLATRAASGKILNAISEAMPWFMGGDADLSCSTKTALNADASFDGQSGAGRNFHFGVREHGMTAIANGMAYHGGLRAFVATFLVFSDYMRPSVRLAAMNHLPIVCIWTHDSIALGEDGPTHQPVEHVMTLRAIPGLTVFRPCDANETLEAWKWIADNQSGPAALVLTRQKVPTLDRNNLAKAEGLQKGAYILSEASSTPAVVLLSTGSEIHLCLDAQEELESQGISCRVVSMPCWELFDQQGQDYQDAVLGPDSSLKVAVEAGTTMGWHRWTGSKGIVVGIDRFGASAPASVNMVKFGFTKENIVSQVTGRLQ